jgi:hypothetical protein
MSLTGDSLKMPGAVRQNGGVVSHARIRIARRQAKARWSRDRKWPFEKPLSAMAARRRAAEGPIAPGTMFAIKRAGSNTAKEIRSYG